MLHLEGVTKHYGGRAVLRDVSFRLERGQQGLVTGPSGSGKTTLLHLLCALEHPDRGKVMVAGRDVARLRRGSLPFLRRNLGVVEQEPCLIPERTVAENAMLQLEVIGLARGQARGRVQTMLGSLGLASLAGVPAGRLSAGERRWAALARALVSEPELLLVDDPTQGLDPQAAQTMLEHLGRLRGRGTTVLLASHDLLVVNVAEAQGWTRLALGADEGAAAPIAVDHQPTMRTGWLAPPPKGAQP